MLKLVNYLTSSSGRTELLNLDNKKVYGSMLSKKLLNSLRKKQNEAGVPASELCTSLTAMQMKTIKNSLEQVSVTKLNELVKIELSDHLLNQASFLHDTLVQRGDSMDASSRLSLALEGQKQYEQRRGISKLYEGAAKYVKLLVNPEANFSGPSVRFDEFTLESRHVFPQHSLISQAATNTKDANNGGDTDLAKETNDNNSSPNGNIASCSVDNANDVVNTNGKDSASRASSIFHSSTSSRKDIGSARTRVTKEELSAAFRKKYGYSVRVGPSTAPHPTAGQGLFLQGEALVGSIVALGGGAWYSRSQLKFLPNYPRIVQDNDYLSCFSFDMSVLNAKVWGVGDSGEEPIVEAAAAAADSGKSSFDSGMSNFDSGKNNIDSGSTMTNGTNSWSWATWCGPVTHAVSLFLDGRHPLAAAHKVNHPPRGSSPNVMEMWVDIPGDHPLLKDHPSLRSFLPVTHFSHVLSPPMGEEPEGFKSKREELEAAAREAAEEVASDGLLRKMNSGSIASEEEGEARGREGKEEKKRNKESGNDLGLNNRHEISDNLQDSNVSRDQLKQYVVEMLNPPLGFIRIQALVAIRTITEGEEIFQDYRLNPSATRPRWYVSHNPDDEDLRWNRSTLSNAVKNG